VEQHLDEIAEGKLQWDAVVREFYGDFEKDLEAAVEQMTVTRLKPQLSSEKCPKCGKPMYLRESRYGKYLSCSGYPNCKGKIPLSATGEKLEPIETSEKCEKCGRPMVIRMGRRGPFMACSGYPECRNTYSVDAQGRKIARTGPVQTSLRCEKSGHPMLLRQGKRGYFLTCSGFPKCRNLKPLSQEEGERLKAESKNRD